MDLGTDYCYAGMPLVALAIRTRVVWMCILYLRILPLVLIVCCPPNAFWQKGGGQNRLFRQARTPDRQKKGDICYK